MRQPTQPAEIFVIHAPADRERLEELTRHLSGLEQRGLIDVWHQDKIAAGDHRQQVAREALEHAQMVLLLVSPAFMASTACQELMRSALTRKHRVVPVLVEPVEWPDAPFDALQMVPRGHKAIATSRNRDAAWVEVVREISSALQDGRPAAEQDPPPPPSPGAVRKLINALLPLDVQLDAACDDHFPRTRGLLPERMDRLEKVTRLFRLYEPSEVVEILRTHYEDFKRHEHLLRGTAK